ncbi:putative membrane protein [Bacillus phage AR9]|uniref:Uncharacterized protein n=2 Tax=Bacillus phage PBS1 TaxID=10683 RepID=A0A223LD32_BPPB1|nr:hypothetical protein BI022_gp108 [Bacillus phage AR9]YP_009664506.1 hypothetical protein FK780_gp142 [Bacillus phage PBS1]AMS01193.1 putative membrane protein [Bacillus phage AR9]ASU00127.1 hypothetical protein PBI_PBS1_305 [Bacillus phage PBS1]BDE75364.1 hypothetical protein [Bacillus phage PBS1]
MDINGRVILAAIAVIVGGTVLISIIPFSSFIIIACIIGAVIPWILPRRDEQIQQYNQEQEYYIKLEEENLKLREQLNLEEENLRLKERLKLEEENLKLREELEKLKEK